MEALQKEKKNSIHLYSHRPSNHCSSVPFIFVQRQNAGRQTCVDETFYFFCGKKGPISELTYLCPGSIIPELCDLGPVPQPL